MILSERLELRKLTIVDAPFILELLNDGDFHRYIGDRGVRTLADAENYIQGKCEQVSQEQKMKSLVI